MASFSRIYSDVDFIDKDPALPQKLALDGSDRKPVVELQDVWKRFNKVPVLNGINLTIRKGEYFSILGPSGCGKTTLLRIIAGLEIQDKGVVKIDEVDAVGWPAHRRPVNTVFQNYALFPHMSVAENIGFGLRMKRMKSHEISREVMRALQLMRLMEVASRKPSQISGGEKQRTALARAIVNEPKVLLLDEPMSALDQNLRRELQRELRSLQLSLGITFIHVTHDQEEALALSDRVAVMDEGEIEQVGETRQLYEHPKTRFAAEFIGNCNVWAGKFLFRDGDEVTVETQLGKIRSHFPHSEADQADRNQLTIAIRPEKIQINPQLTTDNCYRGTVEEIVYQGATSHLKVRHEDLVVRVIATNTQVAVQRLTIGDDVTLHLPPENLLLLDS